MGMLIALTRERPRAGLIASTEPPALAASPA
jgi:hypothetical protein